MGSLGEHARHKPGGGDKNYDNCNYIIITRWGGQEDWVEEAWVERHLKGIFLLFDICYIWYNKYIWLERDLIWIYLLLYNEDDNLDIKQILYFLEWNVTSSVMLKTQ